MPRCVSLTNMTEIQAIRLRGAGGGGWGRGGAGRRRSYAGQLHPGASFMEQSGKITNWGSSQRFDRMIHVSVHTHMHMCLWVF